LNLSRIADFGTWVLVTAYALEWCYSVHGAMPNITFDQPAGSHSLAAAGQRGRYPDLKS